jgi:hypothetical protein
MFGVLSLHQKTPRTNHLNEVLGKFCLSFCKLDHFRSRCCKTFYGHTLLMFKKARVFVPSRPFQISLLFAGKTTSLPQSGAPKRCFTRVGSDGRQNIPEFKFSKTKEVLYFQTISVSFEHMSFLSTDSAQTLLT